MVNPMVSSKGKLQEEGPPKELQTVWTAGCVEPGDKWMVTIIPLTSAPNPLEGPLTVQWHLSFFTHLPFFSHIFGEGGLKTV